MAVTYKNVGEALGKARLQCYSAAEVCSNALSHYRDQVLLNDRIGKACSAIGLQCYSVAILKSYCATVVCSNVLSN